MTLDQSETGSRRLGERERENNRLPHIEQLQKQQSPKPNQEAKSTTWKLYVNKEEMQ